MTVSKTYFILLSYKEEEVKISSQWGVQAKSIKTQTHILDITQQSNKLMIKIA